jgi:predicted MPP superfamily phosphohydrolase
MVFFTVLAVLLVYTGYKAGQMWPARRVMAWGLATLFVALTIGWWLLYRSDPSVLGSDWFRALAWFGSLCMGLWATFIFLSVATDILRLAAWGVRRIGNRARVDPARRSFLSRWIPAGVVWSSAGIAGLGFAEAVRGPQVKELLVPIPNLPSALQGFTIAQISDLHVGPTIQRGYVDEVVRQTNALEPDLIVVTGDIADGSPAVIGEYLQPFADLKSRLGIYYVTGNHEYYWGVERWLESVRGLGLLPLLNENRILTVDDAKILLAGVTDSAGGSFLPSHRSDATRARRSTEECQLRILLAHRPNNWSEAEALGFDLQLSGHTHGGQFFPWSVFMPLAYKYYRGLSRHGRMWIFVSSGTGYWGPAHRFAVPSEIALLRLTAA